MKDMEENCSLLSHAASAAATANECRGSLDNKHIMHNHNISIDTNDKNRLLSLHSHACSRDNTTKVSPPSTAGSHKLSSSKNRAFHAFNTFAASPPLSAPPNTDCNSSSIPKDSSHSLSLFSVLKSDRKKFHVFIYCILNILFTFIELGVGWFTGSLGLFSDGLHMASDSVIVAVNLGISLAAILKPNIKSTLSSKSSVKANWEMFEWSWGWDRIEVISGFANALILLWNCLEISLEAVAKLSGVHHGHGHGNEVGTENDSGDNGLSSHASLVLFVSMLGLAINLIGIFALHGHHHLHHHHDHDHDSEENSHVQSGSCAKHHHDHSHDHDHHHHNHSNEKHSHLFHGMFLHVLADTLGSVAVIFSTFLIRTFGPSLNWVDAATSLGLSILIVGSAWPLFKHTFHILMLGKPQMITFNSHYLPFMKELNEISDFNNSISTAGVTEKATILPKTEASLEYWSDLHVWQITEGNSAATIKLFVKLANSSNNDQTQPNCAFLTKIKESTETLLKKHFKVDTCFVEINLLDPKEIDVRTLTSKLQ